jgi:hypothetical protein
MGGVCSTYGRDEKFIQVLVRKLERNKTHGGLRRRWEDNIRMDLTELEEP